MQRGDGLLLVLIGLGLVLTLLDGVTGGALAGWTQAQLPGLAQTAGLWIGRVGLWLSPLLLIPLICGLAGRFMRLPAPVWALHERAIGGIDRITSTIGGAARWFALGLVLVTALVVVQRYVFGFASTKLQESVFYLHALLFLLSSASALLHGGHVRVDVFYAKADARGKAWTDLVGTYLALMPMCALILWSSTGYMNSTWRILERSRESDGLPLVFMLKTAIPLFAILMILQGLSMAARAAMTLAGRRAPATPEGLGAEA